MELRERANAGRSASAASQGTVAPTDQAQDEAVRRERAQLVAKRLLALELRRQKRQKLLFFVLLVALVAAAVTAVFFPHLRTSIALFVGAGALLYARSSLFAVPGVNAMPFARLGRLVRANPPQGP